MKNYLVFQPVHTYFKNCISAWKLKELFDESIKAPATSKSLFLALNHINSKIHVKRNRSYLKQEKVTFTHKQRVNIYIL